MRILNGINLFTQKVIYTGYSRQECDSILNVLEKNEIKFNMKEWHTRHAQARGRGTIGELSQYSVMYKIYIHHKDYEYAMYLINQI